MGCVVKFRMWSLVCTVTLVMGFIANVVPVGEAV